MGSALQVKMLTTRGLVLLTMLCLVLTLAEGSVVPGAEELVKRTGPVHHGTGTSCVVKGSYCQCHYCKCEKGQLHCRAKGLGFHKGFGKRYCYGSMEGEYCHCDYCRCKHGYGLSGHGNG